jgi:hypothetical protein
MTTTPPAAGDGRRDELTTSRVHTDVSRSDVRRLIAIYLNDHLAGSAAGLSIVRRCQRANAGTELARQMGEIEADLETDRRALRDLMARFDVRPNRLKQAMGSVGALAARLKRNGRIVGYSPLSRVIDLEALASGIMTKRSLWTSLRAVADQHNALDAAELDALIAFATSQYDRVMAEHDRAAGVAFPGPTTTAD